MTFKHFQKKGKSILSESVMKIPGKPDCLTWADLFHGVFCTGNAGSGKTSGPLATLMRSILTNKRKPGGLFICVKTSDRMMIEKAVKDAGRTNDLVIISADSPYKVNALAYELFRKGTDQVEYNQALDLLMEVFALGENYQAGGASGGEQERFWDKSLRRCLLRLIMLLVLSKMPVTIQNMRKILIDTFSEDDVQRYQDLWTKIEQEEGVVQDEAIVEYQAWCESNFFLHCFEQANLREDLNTSEQDVMQLVGDYFLKIWCKISERTKAIIVESAMGLFEPFTTGILKSHFSSEMSEEVRPELCYEEGKLILLDIPIKEFGISGIYGAGMVKKLFQLCVERRVVELETNPRPCFFWSDEYHFTVSPASDDRFQTSCRSTMTATIYCTQSINNIKVSMGKSAAEAKTKALLTNLGTQIFCGNICRDTNTYASELIGKEFVKTNSTSFNSNDGGSHTYNEQLHHLVPPEHYTTLGCGGPEHKYKVETIIVCRSKKWSTGEPFLEATFDQRGPGGSFFAIIKSFFV